MNTKIQKLVDVYLDHMDQYASGDVSLSNMLVSSAGVGKTTFIKTIAKLLGIGTVIIEAPHLIEEKIINIPFMVKQPTSDNTTSGTSNANAIPSKTNDEYGIELADSHLYTQLVQAKKLPDPQYIDSIYKEANLTALYENLGGTKEKIPQIITDLRNHYKVILFVDEYFRTPSQAITALLRSLLNKRLGMHQIPSYVYVTFASNESDIGGSIRPRMDNERFNTIELEPPTKDEWFDWLINEVKDNHKNIELNMDIINKFHKELDDEDISNEFTINGGDDIIRMSPRRWEQLILYINAAFPLKDKNDAMALLTNVNVNFLHYIEKESHPIANKVLKAVVDLVKQLSKIELSVSDMHAEADWRHTFKHQLEMKQKLGESRKYIPVISGPPGVGKTAVATTTAEELNLRLIVIDCSEIVDPGEVIGMPIKTTGTKGEAQVKFSESKIYKQINEQIAMADQSYKNKLYQIEGGKEQWEKYEKARWKYLIFFDEMTVAPPQVMNALRRILLEKSFGEKDNAGKEMVLPKEAIVMGAINPTGKQVTELTHHMRDVLDIVPSDASWTNQKAHLETRNIKGVSDEITEVVISSMEEIASKYGDKSKPADKQIYFIDTGVVGDIYISPNHLSDVFATSSRLVQRVMDRARNARGTLSDLSKDQLKQLETDIKDAIFDGYKPKLIDVFKNNDMMPDHYKPWLDNFSTWLHSDNCKVGSTLIKENTAKQESIDTILHEHLTGINKNPMHNDTRFINYIKANNKNHVEIAHDIKQWIIDTYNKSNDKDKLKYFAGLTKKMQVLDEEDDNTSLKDYVHVDQEEDGIESEPKITPMLSIVLQMGLALIMNDISGEIYSSIRQLTDDPVDRLVEDLEDNDLITNDEYGDIFNASIMVAHYLEVEIQ